MALFLLSGAPVARRLTIPYNQSIRIEGRKAREEPPKNAIMQAFQELLEELPFDKITVSMLVRRCGIHHNTFYYHYQDIYQLLEEWMNIELGRFSREDADGNWEESLKELLHRCRKNRNIVNHILHSLSREHLERYVFSSADDVFDRYVAREAEGKGLPAETAEDIATFCRYAFIGFFLKFVWNNMEDDIDISAARMSGIFRGFVSQALSPSGKTP